jgi:DNA-binding transcriptional MerR regulator
MKLKNVPGTVLPLDEYTQGTFETIAPALRLSGGFSLSQVCSLTGLEPTTIQNWIKRGWVAKPVNKKYFERQISRILIINALRDALSLEQIVKLLAKINGSVEDKSDDIIPEAKLFDCLCNGIKKICESADVSDESFCRVSEELLEGYSVSENSRGLLKNSLRAMLTACCAALLKRQSDALIKNIQE